MRWDNTQKNYGAITKTLHWLVVLLILVQFGLGITMASLAKDSFDTIGGFTRLDWLSMHQSFGVLLLFLVIVRIVWRRVSTLPDWAESLTKGDQTYAHVVERLLYLLMLLAPLSGLLLVMSVAESVNFFGLQIPSLIPHNESITSVLETTHAISRMALVLVFLFHIGFVLKHQFINKDQLIKRMLP